MFFEQQASHAGSSEDFRPLLNYSSSLFCGCPQVPVLCGHAASLMRGHTARVFSLLHSSRVLFCGIPQQPVPVPSVLFIPQFSCGSIPQAVLQRTFCMYVQRHFLRSTASRLVISRDQALKMHLRLSRNRPEHTPCQ